MRTLRRLAVMASFAVLACHQKAAHGPDAGSSDARPIRTMVSDPFLSTPPRNLILNPAFFGESYSGWFAYYPSVTGAISTGDPTLKPIFRERRLQSPAGAGAIVAFVGDAQGSPGSSRRIIVANEFVGGPGPFDASVWLSYAGLDGSPQPFPADPAVQVTIGSAGYNPPVDGKAWDLQPSRDQVTIEGRTWVRFQGTIPGPIDSEGLLLIRLGGIGGAWHIVAPEVVPTALEDETMPFVAPLPSRASVPTSAPRGLDAEAIRTLGELERARLNEHPPTKRQWPQPGPRIPGQGR